MPRPPGSLLGFPPADFYTRARVLFDGSANHDVLAARIEAGAEIAVAGAPTAGETDIDDFLGDGGIPMFVLTPGKRLRILVAGDRPALEPGQELIGMIDRT